MSTMPKLAASNRPFATVLVDVCARAAPLRNQLRRGFGVRCSARTRALPKGPIVNDIRNSADQEVVRGVRRDTAGRLATRHRFDAFFDRFLYPIRNRAPLQTNTVAHAAARQLEAGPAPAAAPQDRRSRSR
jgi:hypothetical protein